MVCDVIGGKDFQQVCSETVRCSTDDSIASIKLHFHYLLRAASTLQSMVEGVTRASQFMGCCIPAGI